MNAAITRHNNDTVLAGLRILDLSRVLAGPIATMILGDLGADVLKVERPPYGDDTRGWGPPFDDRGQSAYFLSVNRNKLSLAADLGRPEDRALVERLSGDADVVVDNFRPGVLARLGLSPEDLLARHRRLIWCTISGFGADSARPGYDFVVQAESGWMSVTGPPGGEPVKVGIALADVVAGRDAVIAILAGLVARSTTGTGRRLHISLRDSAIASLVNVAQNVLVTGREAARYGNAHPNLVPYDLFPTADGAIVIAVGNDAQWQSLLGALGLAELGADAALATNAGRVSNRDRVTTAIRRRVSGESAAAVQRALDAADVPNGVVKTVLEALSEVESSALTGVQSSVGGSARRPPPLLDEHGDAIRRDGWAAFARLAR